MQKERQDRQERERERENQEKMGDRLTIRDRALILRVLVPGLETRLRDKVRIRLIQTYVAWFWFLDHYSFDAIFDS